MNISNLIITFIISGIVVYGAEPAENAEDKMITELRALVKIEPNKRTKDQKERVREIWRTSQEVKKVFHNASVLQVGDSIFDFPGLIQHLSLKYEETKREYQSGYSYSKESGESGHDQIVIIITFSEDGIVTNKEHMKVNSR